MSNNELETFIGILPSIIFVNRWGLAVTVLSFYEWLIMFPTEITLFWSSSSGAKRKVSSSLVLYYITRYAALLYWACQTVNTFAAGNDKLCAATLNTSFATGLLYVASASIVFILRTWAIYGRNVWVLLGLSTLTVVRMLGVFSDFWEEQSTFQASPTRLVGGCNAQVARSYGKWSASATSLNLVFTTAVFVLTLAKTLGASREAKRAGIQGSLYSLLLRDGMIYYFSLVMFSAAELVVLSHSILNRHPEVVAISFPTTTLNPILTCRLILNLRQTSSDVDMQDLGSSSQESDTNGRFRISFMNSSSSSRFASSASGFLGNLGAPLRDSEVEFDVVDKDGDGLDFEGRHVGMDIMENLGGQEISDRNGRV